MSKELELIELLVEVDEALRTLVEHPDSVFFNHSRYSNDIYAAVNKLRSKVSHAWWPYYEQRVIEGPRNIVSMNPSVPILWYGEKGVEPK